jgi:hypothetical protein
MVPIRCLSQSEEGANVAGEIVTVELGEQTLERLGAIVREAVDEAFGRNYLPTTNVEADISGFGARAVDELREAVALGIADAYADADPDDAG